MVGIFSKGEHNTMGKEIMENWWEFKIFNTFQSICLFFTCLTIKTFSHHVVVPLDVCICIYVLLMIRNKSFMEFEKYQTDCMGWKRSYKLWHIFSMFRDIKVKHCTTQTLTDAWSIFLEFFFHEREKWLKYLWRTKVNI